METPYLRRGDNTLKTRLKGDNERGQVLKWLVDGAVEWYASRDLKANPPPDVVAYTKEYFSGQDRLGSFMTECCDLRAKFRVDQYNFMQAYKEWADVTEMTGFVQRMAAKGLVKAKIRVKGHTNPVWGYVGIMLKPDVEAGDASEPPPPTAKSAYMFA